MEAPVRVDALERRGKVVGVVDQEAAGLLRQRAETRRGVLVQQERAALEVGRARAAAVPLGDHLQALIVVADAAQLGEAARGRGLLAVQPQALRVDGVDRHVAAVGGVDHGAELRLERVRHRDAL